jgi:D-alanine-D-alanine ligase
MPSRVALVYDEPVPSRYDIVGETKAVFSILEVAAEVSKSLLQLGYRVVRVPLVLPITQAQELLRSLEADLIFNLFEGFSGYPETEATVPEIATEIGIPYTGCPAHVLSLALDKAKTKELLTAAGIKTPPYQVLTADTIPEFHLNFPCIVKPLKEDGSHGITEMSLVRDTAELARQVAEISTVFGGFSLVEEFIDGREFNATVIGNSSLTVLPISEIVYSLPPEMPRILTYAAKWEPGTTYFEGTEAVCPAKISEPQRKKITDVALATYRAFQCHGYARVDMRLSKEGEINVLEFNPNPDIAPGTGAARQAAAAGMTYTQFIEKIVSLAQEKVKHECHHPPHVPRG